MTDNTVPAVLPDTITLTGTNPAEVIDWLIAHGVDAAPPDDPGSGTVLAVLPARIGVVMPGDTMTAAADTVIVTRSDPDNPPDLFLTRPAATRPAPAPAVPVAAQLPAQGQWEQAGRAFVAAVETLASLAPTPVPLAAHLPRPAAQAAGQLAPPARGVSPTPPELPAGVRLIEPPAEYEPLPGEVALSTLGGIPGVDPWHDRMIVTAAILFTDRFPGRKLAIICPRRRDVTRALDRDELTAQVWWEYTTALLPARLGVNTFWFPASNVQFPQPTSLVEFGDCRGARARYEVGAHRLYHRRDVLEMQVPLDGHQLFDRLDHTVHAAMDRLAELYAWRGSGADITGTGASTGRA